MCPHMHTFYRIHTRSKHILIFVAYVHLSMYILSILHLYII